VVRHPIIGSAGPSLPYDDAAERFTAATCALCCASRHVISMEMSREHWRKTGERLLLAAACVSAAIIAAVPCGLLLLSDGAALTTLALFAFGVVSLLLVIAISRERVAVAAAESA